MSWLGLDDTDSPKGGCTTWVLSEVLRELSVSGHGIDLVGPPRLVRLNPNVPWKTRGNAALSARFGVGVGAPRGLGEFGRRRRPLLSYPRGKPLTASQEDELWRTAVEVVLRSSDRSVEGTDPTVLLTPGPLPPDLYWRAVREVVPWRAVEDQLLEVPGVRLAAFGSGQGVVGAAASIAWPGRRATWEAIAYRHASRWGSARNVDAGSVRRVAARYPETFLSYDDETRRTMVAPHTPCPILFGMRASRPDRLPKAIAEVTPGEPLERWLLFRTNQATGDHLVRRTLGDRAPASSGIYEGLVADAPELLTGGHVRFRIEAGGVQLPCVAFEPTKRLPKISRALLRGDRVRVWGSFPFGPGEADRGVRLEGIQVLSTRPVWEKVRNPRCPSCGRRMGSVGAGKGFRCSVCGRRTAPERAKGRWVARGAMRGTYLPTPSARRHLAPRRAPARA